MLEHVALNALLIFQADGLRTREYGGQEKAFGLTTPPQGFDFQTISITLFEKKSYSFGQLIRA